jgi:hypothetical protein
MFTVCFAEIVGYVFYGALSMPILNHLFNVKVEFVTSVIIIKTTDSRVGSDAL